MQVDPAIFKAYDVRGLYGEQIDEDVAYRLGRAYARVLTLVRKLDVPIEGGDGRIHVYYCENANCEPEWGSYGAPPVRTYSVVTPRLPNCGNSAYGLSNVHSEPDGRFWPPSEVSHVASRTLTTNHPSLVGERPEPESWSRASGTSRV